MHVLRVLGERQSQSFSSQSTASFSLSQYLFRLVSALYAFFYNEITALIT